jgi:hypothetical protein
MSKTKRPPLTPADSTYLGTIVGDLELIRWESQSRHGVRHYTNGTLRGAENCSCEWRQNNPASACKHMLAFVDALRHHLGEPPPADPGGAALDAAQDALDGEQQDWETVELSPEHPGGFWAATAYGPMHVTGDPHMSDETLGALREMAELAVRQQLDPTPNALDRAVAADGDRWLQSRTAAGVRLTCVACHAVRGWASEGMATAWLEGGGVCGCGGAGPTPPAPGAARKPLDECLLDLYGA